MDRQYTVRPASAPVSGNKWAVVEHTVSDTGRLSRGEEVDYAPTQRAAQEKADQKNMEQL